MAEFSVPLNAEGDLLLQLPARLSKRLLAIDLSKASDPARAINNGLSRLAGQLTELLDALQQVEFNENPGGDEARAILSAWEDVAYTATEVFESYQSKLTHALPQLNDRSIKKQKSSYIELVKSHRNRWAFLANKIKHESNHLAPVTQIYNPSLRIVHGYSLVRPSGIDAMEVNKQFHKGRERCRSFNLELRQLIYDLLRVDRGAAELVESLDEIPGTTALPEYKIVWKVSEQLVRVAARPFWPLPEEPRLIDGFSLSGGHVRTARQAAEIIREPGRVSVQFTADGITRSFPII